MTLNTYKHNVELTELSSWEWKMSCHLNERGRICVFMMTHFYAPGEIHRKKSSGI